MNRPLVVGVGMSSQATSADVSHALRVALNAVGRTMADVALVATRTCFVGDSRLPIGVPQQGFDDDDLIVASEPPERTVGIPARVAQTAALLASTAIAACYTPDDAPHGELLIGQPVAAHKTTVALAPLVVVQAPRVEGQEFAR